LIRGFLVICKHFTIPYTHTSIHINIQYTINIGSVTGDFIYHRIPCFSTNIYNTVYVYNYIDIVTCRVIRDRNIRGFSGFNKGVYLNPLRYYTQQK
jgi:hypothetical protein